MAASKWTEIRTRLHWRELDRLTVALALSLALHAAVYGGYQANKKFGLLKLLAPAWLQKVHQRLVAVQPKNAIEQQTPDEPPLVFVQVNPAAATAEPPRNAKYYSSQSAKAANAESDIDSNVPKITGSQEQIVRTEDVPRSKAFPLQPSAPKAAPELQEEEKQRRSQLHGDLALAKPDSVLHKDDGQSTRSRPRTIVEAKARQQQSNPLAGEKMKQQGGVKRNQLVPSFDVKATSFGAYDEALIRAVQNRWYDLLDNRNFAGERTGKVSLQFQLHPDGRVSDLKVLENTVDELLSLLCQKAILDPAPFEKWPTQMRMQIGEEREIRFTFYYN